MQNQIRLADSAIAAARKCEAAGNVANAGMFWRLAGAHLEQAAAMVPCERGVPLDDEARRDISTRYRLVIDHDMRVARAARVSS